VIAGDDDLDEKVRAIGHPSLSGYEEFREDRGINPSEPIHRKWRNAFCDIDGMVAHIRNGHDVFVTEDAHST
jgi:hypothetical protein